jgi:hypothetical protein
MEYLVFTGKDSPMANLMLSAMSVSPIGNAPHQETPKGRHHAGLAARRLHQPCNPCFAYGPTVVKRTRVPAARAAIESASSESASMRAHPCAPTGNCDRTAPSLDLDRPASPTRIPAGARSATQPAINRSTKPVAP